MLLAILFKNRLLNVLTREKCELLLKRIDRFAEEGDLIRIYRLNQNVQSTIYGEKEGNKNEEFYFI